MTMQWLSFEVLRAAMKVIIFGDVMPCTLRESEFL
jgi:hypothetical protein